MYHHSTMNELLFDDLRDITYRLNIIRGYLSSCDVDSAVVDSLNIAETLVFDGAYIALRNVWLDSSGLTRLQSASVSSSD